MQKVIPALILIFSLTLPEFLFAQYTNIDPGKYFTAAELAQANTAVNENYLTKEEKNIYLYTNLVRLFPRKFYSFYRAYAIEDGNESKLRSNSYYTSLTKELRSMQPVTALLPDKKMYDLAKCWAVESGKKGIVGHDREDCPVGYHGENCGYGYNPTGQYFVMALLIDEGVKSLGHRKNILLPAFKGLGAAISDHKEYKYCAVQNFAYTNDVVREQDRQNQIAFEKAQAEDARMRDARQAEFEALMSQWDRSDIQAADVTRSLSYLNELEKDFYFYTNLIRLNPKKFKELIWDNGPFFDQLNSELDNGVRKQANYQKISRWLQTTNASRVFVPNKTHIEILRCVIDEYNSGKQNFKGCFKMAGAWRFQTFYSESNFNDVMNILLTDEDFSDLFEKNSTLALHHGDPSIKLFFTPN